MEAAEASFGALYRLTVDFTEMLRKRQPERLRPWLEAAQASEFPELKSLATGMECDYTAVETACASHTAPGRLRGTSIA